MPLNLDEVLSDYEAGIAPASTQEPSSVDTPAPLSEILDDYSAGLAPEGVAPSAPADEPSPLLAIALQKAQDEAPDAVAKRNQVAKQLGISPALVTPAAMKDLWLKQNDPKELARTSPKLAKLLEDSSFAAVASDSIDGLGSIEKHLVNTGRSLAAAFPRMRAAISGAVYGVAENLATPRPLIPKSLLSDNAVKALEAADRKLGVADSKPGLIEQAASKLAGVAKSYADAQTAKAEALAPDLKDANWLERGFHSGIESGATALPLLATEVLLGGRAKGKILAAGFSGQTLGQSYLKADDVTGREALTPSEKLQFATRDAMLEYYLGLLPSATLVAGATGKTGLVDMVKNFAMRELPSEQATTHLQDLNAWATLNPTKPFTEYMRERPDAALETLVATLVGGGIQVGAATGTAKALGAIRPKAPATEDADAAVQAHEALRAAAEAATANPLRTRDESAFHQAISSMSDDPDAISEVYVAPTALRDALTSSGVNIADIESKVPGLTAEMAEAIDKGHDVRLKTADFLTYLAPTPAGEAILSGLRVAPGGMTYAESQEHYMNEVRGLAESASSDRVLSETEFNALSEAEKQLLTQPQATAQPVEAAPAPDRRKDTARRKRIAEMSPEEMQRALLTSELTGLPNRRAYEDAVKAPVQGSIDADSLKWVNDNMSPESGDALLRGIGEALRAEGIEAYHISGDEFMTQGQSAEEIDAAMARVQARLKNAVIRVQKPDGSIIEKRGLEVTYGTGADKNEADYRLKESKRQRESAGLRAGRGEQPPGISKIAPAGQPDTGGDVPVAEQPVAEQPVAEQSTGKRRLSYAEYVASHPNSRAAARATAQADARTIRRNLEAQLRIAGHSGTRAEVDARAVTEFYSTMAARLGISASELYRKYPLRIVKVEGQSSKAASPGDVTPAGIAHLLEKDNWAILTAENPGNTALSPAENAVRTERLKSQLRTAGYLAEEVRGRYGVDENESVSFLVYGITQADAQELGKAYGQEAILTRAGLVYQDGSVSPARGIKTFGTPPENFYTRVPRTGVVFSVDLNLDERIAPAYAQTNPETAPLYGLPDRVTVDGAVRRFGPSASIREVAKAYASAAGINYQPPRDYVRVDPDRAKRIADAFDAMPHNPKDPAVKAAYDALISETLAQWEAIKAAGLQVEFIEGADPYGNPRNAILDITENNHMWVYPTTAGFGTGAEVDTSDSPMLAIVPGETISGKPVRVNDIFRIVHDYFGHAKEGVGFRADGEENAWRSHSAMYSPLARKALATETRGQNSWLNYGPHGDRNRTAKVEDTVFAPQKVGLLPDWVVTNGAVDPVSVVGVHFSNTPRTELRGDKYGTGITGAEAKRLKFADPRLKSRISFYIDEGNGIKPEPGLGKARHDVPLNNLYDAKANPLGLPTKDPNEFEAAVIDAGFDGYYVAGAFSTQGAAVLLGRAAERVPTTGGSLFQGVRGEFDPSTLTIRLMSGADLSTVTHEAAHFYLEVLADMAAAEDAPKGIKDDFAKALAWFGISAETWYGLDTEGKREYHERWAESFELFTLEGKAPAVSLQPTFSQIRSWMLKVYLSVEQFLKINPRAGMLNDEIRGVFSRLLATEDAIAVAEQERGYADLLVAVAKADTEGAKAAAYRALGAAATQDAVDTLTARSMRDMKWLSGARNRKLKELQHKADEARQAVRAEVTAELLKQPVYAVRADLARKDGPKLNSDMLRDMYPSIDLRILNELAAPGGVELSDLAAQYGFESEADMLTELASAPALETEAELLTDLRMRTDHSVIETPEVAMREATAKRKELKKDILTELSSTLVYAAQAELSRRDGPKLNSAALKKQMPGLKLNSLAGKISPTGAGPEAVAKQLGFDSVKTMVAALTSTPDIEVEAERMTAERMQQKYPDLVTPTHAARASVNKRKEVYDATVAELGKTPVHALRAAMAHKDGPRIRSDSLKKLSEQPSLRALAGKVSPKGADPNIIATQYGFPSAEAMVSDILTLPSLQEEVDAITDRRMLERHSELADPIAVAQAVDAALHNEGRARFLATGLSILSKSPIPVRQLVRAAKDAAEQVINSKRLRDIRPDQYTAAEQRANKLVISTATDSKAAINAQREALLNHQLGRTAAEALDEVASARRRIMKLRKASIQKKMRGGYLEQLNALLDRFDLRDRMSVAALEKERTESLDAWIKNTAQNLSAIYPDIPGKILDESYRKNYRDMTLEEFREVVAAVEALETLARREEEQYQAIRGMKFADEKAAFLSRVREVYPEAFSPDGNPLPVRPELRKKYIPVGDVAERLYAEFISSETVANIMEGGTVGAVHESLIQRMSTGADERQRRLAAVIDLLKPALKKYSRKDKYLLSRKKIATIGNDELSRENVIVAALLWGNQEGRARLLNYGWDPKAVQAAFTKLQPKDLDLIESIWDMFDTHLWPDLEALNKRTRGKAPPKVEALPFTVGGRELRGGYFKLQYISDDVSPTDPEVELEQLMSGGYGLSAKTAQGSSTERMETVAKRPRLDMGVLNEAVNETVNDLALREAVADTIRVLRDPDIRAVITNTQGPQAYQAFVQSIQDAAARPRDPSGFISKTLSLARRNTLAAMLSGLSTAVQNVSGFAAVVAREPRIAGPLAREIARLATTPWAVIAHAEANSKYYAERSKSYDQDVVQASDRLKLKNRWDVPLGVSLWALVGIDKLISAAVWNAAYALGNKDHSNDKNQAVAYADHLVRQTLGSGRKLDAAQIMRGTGAAGEIKAALTMFGGYFNAQLGLLVRHQALNKRLVNGNPVLASLLFAKNFALYVALPASLVALMFPKPEGDDDEEEDTAKQMAIATARYGTAMIPVVGRFGSSLIDYYVEDSPYRAFQLSPIESAAQSVVKTPDALASVLSGEGTTQDEKNAIMGLGYTFRLPGRLMANTWTAVKDINEGGAEGQEVSTILYGAPYRPE